MCVQYSNKGQTYVMNALDKISGSLETKVCSIKEARTRAVTAGKKAN